MYGAGTIGCAGDELVRTDDVERADSVATPTAHAENAEQAPSSSCDYVFVRNFTSAETISPWFQEGPDDLRVQFKTHTGDTAKTCRGEVANFWFATEYRTDTCGGGCTSPWFPDYAEPPPESLSRYLAPNRAVGTHGYFAHEWTP